jgi:hypothetical protein
MSGFHLLRFFMQRHFFAEFAEFFYFQTLLGIFFILSALVVQVVTDGTFKIDEMVLGHKRDFRFKIYNFRFGHQTGMQDYLRDR